MTEDNVSANPTMKLNIRECRNQIIAASIATLGSFGTGTVFGWSSVATTSLVSDFGQGEKTEDMISWVTSLAILGALFGSPIAGYTMNCVGRRSSMLIFSLPFLIGWIIMCSAYFFKPNGFFLLYIGRILTGMCAGSYLVVIPTYIKEASSDSMRGILGAAVPLMLVTGILYTFIVGAFCNWLATTISCGALPVFLALGTLVIPETPRYLIAKKKMAKAVSAVKWLCSFDSDDLAEEKLRQIFFVEVSSAPNVHKSKGGHLFSRPVLGPIVIIVIVVFFQQFGGVNAVTLYANVILDRAGLGALIEPRFVIIIIGLVEVTFVLVAMFLVDVLGRRTLLAFCSFIMGLSLIGLGAFFYLKEKNDGSEKEIAWLAILTVCTYIAAYSAGVGTIPWILATEIYNPNYRAESSSVMTSAYWIFGFIVAKIFNNLNNALNTSGSFWLYGGFCMGGGIFAILFVPETKGKSSEEILQYFGGVKPTASSHISAGDSATIQPTMTPIVVVDRQVFESHFHPGKVPTEEVKKISATEEDIFISKSGIVFNKNNENKK